jgi:phosphoglycolate phosphatase
MDTLTTLAATTPRMFVATSKPAVYATRIVEHFGLKPYFERVFGSELDGTRVDKRDLLRYALDEARVDPASAIMIGDRSHDVVGARTNGMTAIGVLRRASHLRRASRAARPLRHLVDQASAVSTAASMPVLA